MSDGVALTIAFPGELGNEGGRGKLAAETSLSENTSEAGKNFAELSFWIDRGLAAALLVASVL
jgi:hypothetical protein